VTQLTHSFPHNTSASTANRYSHPESEGSCVPPRCQNKTFLHSVKPLKKTIIWITTAPKPENLNSITGHNLTKIMK